MRRIQLWAILALIGFGLVAAPAEAATNAGVLFLRIAPGARSAAMGEAFVAVSDDATATHWNPAGLGGYPLNNEWDEITLPEYGTVYDAVAVKNDLPFTDTRQFDLWILTDKGLLVVGPSGDVRDKPASPDAVAEEARMGRALNWVKIPTAGVSSVVAAIRKYAPFLSEADAEDLAQAAVAADIGIPVADLEPLLERVLGAMPDGYRDRSLVEGSVTEFRRALREARLDHDRIPELRAALNAVPESGAAAPEELDRVRFALDRAVGGRIPPHVTVMINDLIKPPIRAIGGGDARLYVATENKLLVLERNQWVDIAPPDGVDWDEEGVNCITVAHGARVWVGTDHGIITRLRGGWDRYAADSGLTNERVTKIAMLGQDEGWVMTDGGLMRFDGQRFYANATVTANVGDSLASMLARFLDTKDQVFIAKAEAEVRRVNGLGPDANPEPGTSVAVPYQLGVRGEVNAIDYDSYHRLWVGTNLGVLRYSHGHWWNYGYTERVFDQPTTAAAVAEEQLGSRGSPERIEALAQITIEYNGLDADGSIAAGRTVYVYRNPAAAQVYDLAAAGDRLYIGTATGQLEVKPGDWSRYYHRNLERDQVRAIAVQGGDVWFVTNERTVLFKKAQKEFTAMYSPWLPEFNLDLYYAFGSYVTHVDGWGTLGMAVTFFSYGEIIRTDEYGKTVNTFHSFDGALSLSYGTRLTPNLGAGLSGKVIYSKLADQGAGQELGSGSATAFAMDAGLLYNTPWRRLDLGVALTNVGPNISYIDAQQSDPLPRNLAVGMALRLADSPFNKLMVVADVNKELVDLNDPTSEFKQIVYNVGAEWSYTGMISGRIGYVYDEDGSIKVLTLGVGLSYSGGRIDVAYIPSTGDTPLANTLRYSITARF